MGRQNHSTQNPKALLAAAAAKTATRGPEETLFSTNLLQSADREREFSQKTKQYWHENQCKQNSPPPTHNHHQKVRKMPESNHTEKFCLWLAQKNASNSHQMADDARGCFGFSAIASLLERLLRLLSLAELKPGFVSGGRTIVSSPYFCTPPFCALRKRQQKPLFVERR